MLLKARFEVYEAVDATPADEPEGGEAGKEGARRDVKHRPTRAPFLDHLFATHYPFHLVHPRFADWA